jgi:outer membrane immunogenic protein
MKKLALTIAALSVLTGASALAADMPVKAPLYKAPPPAPSWSGFYVGLNAGYAVGHRNVDFLPNDGSAFLLTCGAQGFGCPPSRAFDISGGLGGVQVGYNWQFAPTALVGIEADFDWARIRGGGTSTFNWGGLGGAPSPAVFDAAQNVKWFGTVRARLGWLPTSNFLLYATAGLAYGRVDEFVGFTAAGNVLGGGGGPGLFCSQLAGAVIVPNCAAGGTSRTATGWTAGGGFEFALGHNVSVKTEYLYVNLGGGDTVLLGSAGFGGLIPPSTPFAAPYSRTDFHVARVGVNFKLY